MKLNIKYLYHSGFSVNVNDTLLVFDYCEHSGNGMIKADEIESAKKKYLLLSHSHYDHYTDKAFSLGFDEIIVSADFPAHLPGIRVNPGMALSGEDMEIIAFGSTDMGVSYLVKTADTVIFHAGDFNFWHWDEESDEAYVKEARDMFEAVLLPIKKYADKIDLAFFPVDKRLGKNCGKGAELFIESIRPKYLVPMHTSDESGKTACDFAENVFEKTRVIPMTVRGETTEIYI